MVGVLLVCDELEGFMIFWLGFFGLDKFYDVDVILVCLKVVLD